MEKRRRTYRSKRDWERFVQLIVSITVLFILVKHTNVKLLVSTWREVRFSYLILATLIVPFSILPRVYRWSSIINREKKSVSLADLYLLTLAGISLNFLLPANLGDIARSYYGHKKTGLGEEMLTSSLVDKLIALFSIFSLGATASFLYGLYSYTYLSLALAVVFAVVPFCPNLLPWGLIEKVSLLFADKVNARQLREQLTLSNKVKITTVVWSIMGWGVTFLIFYIICRAFSTDVKFTYVFAIAPMIILARLCPLTLSGLGTQEAMVVYLFRSIGVDGTNSFLVSITFSFIVSVIPAFIGLFVIANIHHSGDG
ncbi:MAG: lysylphosphatidylglycerol synthase transmembrane domain-containing protein [Anaerolineae bacterium]